MKRFFKSLLTNAFWGTVIYLIIHSIIFIFTQEFQTKKFFTSVLAFTVIMLIFDMGLTAVYKRRYRKLKEDIKNESGVKCCKNNQTSIGKNNKQTIS